jgi:hypothetical protein
LICGSEFGKGEAFMAFFRPFLITFSAKAPTTAEAGSKRPSLPQPHPTPSVYTKINFANILISS